jgi:hypothetical protein
LEVVALEAAVATKAQLVAIQYFPQTHLLGVVVGVEVKMRGMRCLAVLEAAHHIRARLVLVTPLLLHQVKVITVEQILQRSMVVAVVAVLVRWVNL